MEDEKFYDELKRRITKAAAAHADRIVKESEHLADAVHQLRASLEPFRKHLYDSRKQTDAAPGELTEKLKGISRAWCYENPERASHIVTAAVVVMATQMHLEKAISDAENLKHFRESTGNEQEDGA